MKKILLTLTLLVPVMVPISVSAFSDVKDQTNYAYEINWLAENGVVRGHGDGKFYPEQCVSRVEFLKMMYKILESNIDNPAAGTSWEKYFSDIDITQWYWPHLRYALQTGSVKGYPDKTFRPDQCVNRVEAVKMAVLDFNNGKIPKYSALTENFLDVAHNAWYSPMMDYAIAAGVLGIEHREVVSKGKFGSDIKYFPANGMTRGEVAYLLFNLKALKDNNVIANDMALYDKEKVNYNDERGMLMPKKLSVAYVFDGCGKPSKYKASSWWKSLENAATASEIDLSKTVDMCFSQEGNIVIFMTERVIVSIPKSKDLPNGIFQSKIKVHKFTVSSGKIEDPKRESAWYDTASAEGDDIGVSDESEAMKFGKRVGDFIVIEVPSGGAYYEYYFGKNILKGSFKMIQIID